jgi:hypothetical protein
LLIELVTQFIETDLLYLKQVKAFRLLSTSAHTD